MILRRALHQLVNYETVPLPKPLYLTNNNLVESIFDPAHPWGDEPGQREDITEIVGNPTKKEECDYKETMTKIKNEGCAPIKRALSVLMEHVQMRSALKTSLSSCNVTLFNFHSTKFAERLIQRNIGGLVLVESSHIFSKKAKEFAKEQGSADNIKAYRADISSLLGIGRKKLLRLPSQLFPSGVEENALRFETKLDGDESGCRFRKSPILISALPLPSQQTAVLDSLKANALLHHAGLENDTIFRFGAVELVTFLDVIHLSHLLTAVDPRIDFFSHSIRRNSAVFNKFFEVKLLREQGFQRTTFHPPIPKPLRQTQLPHAAKLEKLSLYPGVLYGVSIKPRTYMEINNIPLYSADSNGNFIGSDLLVPLDYWMYAIGRMSNNKKVGDVLRVLSPELAGKALEVIDGTTKIGDASNQKLEEIFLIVSEEVKATNEFKKFAKNLKVKREIDSS